MTDGSTSLRRRAAAHRARRTVAAVFVICLAASDLAAQPRTDIVVLANGDRITGEIKKLDRGKLTLKTDAADTIAIEWVRVEALTSDRLFEVKSRSGAAAYGALRPSPPAGLEVYGPGSSATVDLLAVVEITPIGLNFWRRLEGGLDVGFAFTESSRATEWTASAEARYRARAFELRTEASSLFRSQTGAERVNRNNASLTVKWFLGGHWYVTALSQFSQSERQAVDFRAILGVGVGRYLVRTPHQDLSVTGGIAANEELFADATEFQTEAEVVLGVDYDAFLYSTPGLDLSVSAYVSPSVSQSERVRIDSSARLRLELVKDLYWSASAFVSYDRRPPSALAQRRESGVTTALGWSF